MRLKVKILALIISTFVLVIYISTHYSQRITEKDHEMALMEEASMIARQVSTYVPADGVVADRVAMEEDFLELMLLKPHLVRVDAFLFRKNGGLKHFISKSRYPIGNADVTEPDIDSAKDGRMTLEYEHADGKEYVNVVAPLIAKAGPYGILELKISQEDYQELVSNNRRATATITVLSVLLIAGVLVVSMDFMIGRPIERLLEAISEVKGGNLSVRVYGRGGNDEIGILTEHFNSMMETINKDAREKEALLSQINRHNDELQQKIRLATEEVVSRNEALRAANQSLYNMQKKLGHSRRLAAVGQLAATVAHELGTPLHSISGHLQLLMEEPKLSTEMTRRITIMQSQLERIINSIQNLLDTTRQPDTNVDALDLNRLLEDIIVLVMPETISKQVKVIKDFEEGLPQFLGSSARIQAVFLNLIDNAIDASSKDGVISISTRTANPGAGEELSQGSWLKVSVTDNGKGIPEDYIDHIFTPFYTTKAHGQGTGLGLAIAQEIVHGYHGHIKVKSEVDSGSTFEVYLPAAEAKGNNR